MQLTINLDCPQLEALIELLMTVEDDADTDTTPTCFYGDVCGLIDDSAVRLKAARIQAMLENYMNPLTSKEFVQLLDDILSALIDADVDSGFIESIFCRYIGMTVNEFIDEYCQPQTPPTPPFLQEIAAIADNQDVLTAAANVWYTIENVEDPYNAQKYPEFYMGIATIIKGCGIDGLSKINYILRSYLDAPFDVYGFLYSYPELFTEDK